MLQAWNESLLLACLVREVNCLCYAHQGLPVTAQPVTHPGCFGMQHCVCTCSQDQGLGNVSMRLPHLGIGKQEQVVTWDTIEAGLLQEYFQTLHWCFGQQSIVPTGGSTLPQESGTTSSGTELGAPDHLHEGLDQPGSQPGVQVISTGAPLTVGKHIVITIRKFTALTVSSPLPTGSV